MTDLGTMIAPKTDQLNADSLIAGPITIRVTKVTASGAKDQPISISYEGDDGKPYKPCLSMRRVLVQVWGKDGSAYVGRRMTLYRDQNVQFGGEKVGGIRISHMDGIDSPVTLALTVTRGSRKPYVVQVLRDDSATKKAAKPEASIPERIAAVKKALREADTQAGVAQVRKNAQGLLNDLDREPADLKEDLLLELEARQAELEAAAKERK